MDIIRITQCHEYGQLFRRHCIHIAPVRFIYKHNGAATDGHPTEMFIIDVLWFFLFVLLVGELVLEPPNQLRTASEY